MATGTKIQNAFREPEPRKTANFYKTQTGNGLGGETPGTSSGKPNDDRRRAERVAVGVLRAVRFRRGPGHVTVTTRRDARQKNLKAFERLRAKSRVLHTSR